MDKIYVMHPSLFHSGSLASCDTRRVHFYAGVTSKELKDMMPKRKITIYPVDDPSIFFPFDKKKNLIVARLAKKKKEDKAKKAKKAKI